MRPDQAQPVRLSDYRVPDYLVDTVALEVRLARQATRITARLAIRANPEGRPGAPLVLDGDELHLCGARLDGALIAPDAHLVTPDRFTLLAPPAPPFTLELDTELDPSANLTLMGLYRSGSAYCTQCEAEGFRRITYFLDRPDVLSTYTVRVEAERADAPVLLSNGNPVEAGAVAGTDRHYAVWHDPHPKPCYLFALVGGTLAAVHDVFTTASGRRVTLGIYVEPGKEDRTAYAMDALKRSMRWDEAVFGREYDLDVFNIVAVSDFNMGAMENKGLNVFNDKYVLASPRTATDADYAGIETVIAHEYFHNWTGNRITCRDWFQLCLKEGLTVFRDHEFSADQRSRSVRRIADVRALRASQFPEDAGPLAHPVRPTLYREINNFYTATIYEKGAEVIRMLKVLVGGDAFRRGMELYFTRCDGTATTIEVFLGCFVEASGQDLDKFARWYAQAGTPRLKVSSRYDEASRRLEVDLAQSCPPTPGQDRKDPFVIPVAFGLVGTDGAPVAGESRDLEAFEAERGLIVLDAPARRVTFENLAARPVLSVLRGFSAPVRLDTDASEADLLTLLAADEDSFNRWQASQPNVDPAFVAQGLALPGEVGLAREIAADVDPDAIHRARDALRAHLGAALGPELRRVHHAFADAGPYSPAAEAAGRRALRNTALDLLAAGDSEEGQAIAGQQFDAATNMTDLVAALGVLARTPGAARERALAEFYRRFADDALVIDKWFALQAVKPDADVLDRVRALMEHPAFSLRNPNRVRALIGSFANGNPTRFNAVDGSGFAFVADRVVEIDRFNAQVAARLLAAFRSWRSLEQGRRAQARAALESVTRATPLSADVADIAARSLA